MGFNQCFSITYNPNHNCHYLGNILYNSNESISTENNNHSSTATTESTCQQIIQQQKQMSFALDHKEKFQYPL